MSFLKTQSALFFMMLAGLGCFCVVATACTFPSALMSLADQTSYRLFNQAFYVSAGASALVYSLVVIRCSRKLIAAFAAAGYPLLVLGLIMTNQIYAGTQLIFPFLSGLFCGFGLTIALIFWFAMIISLPERQAILILGWQSLFGSLTFAAIALLNESISSEATVVLCVISALLCAAVYRQNVASANSPFPPEPVKANLLFLKKQRTLSQVLAVPIIGFALIALMYGITQSIAMGLDGSPYGELASFLGLPMGATIFLLWVYLSRNRDYALAMKAIFIILLAVFWIPTFDAIVLVISAGFQLGSLLLYALFIDELFSRRRLAVFLMSVCYALMRFAFLLGLYIPGRFGIPSYSEYFESTSLLMFIAYLVFTVLMFLNYRENRRKLIEKSDAEGQQKDAPRSQRNSKREGLHEGLQENLQGSGQEGLRERLHDSGHEGLRESLQENLREGERHNEHKGEQSGLSQATFDDASVYESIARESGLTKRETEVMRLYARGRDIAYICDELYLSRNTVKGYTKRIYTKLDIHSKQDLIDRVELFRALRESDG